MNHDGVGWKHTNVVARKKYNGSEKCSNLKGPGRRSTTGRVDYSSYSEKTNREQIRRKVNVRRRNR